MRKNRPYFVWDYDYSEEDVRNMLASGDEIEVDWAITRILEYADWKDIWSYLDEQTIRNHIHHLPMRPYLKNLWEYALKRWESNTNKTF